MPNLVAQGDATFLRRYAFGYDGLVREVSLVYSPSGPEGHTARIELSVQEPERGRDAWCNLRLTVTGVSECRIAEGRTTCDVLSDGIFLGWSGDKLRLECLRASSSHRSCSASRRIMACLAGQRQPRQVPRRFTPTRLARPAWRGPVHARGLES